MVQPLPDDQLRRPSLARYTQESEVTKRFFTSGSRDDSMGAYHMTTCLAVAIVGDYERNTLRHDRFLARVDEFEKFPLNAFARRVRLAKRRGLTNLRGYTVGPWLDEEEEVAVLRQQRVANILESLVTPGEYGLRFVNILRNKYSLRIEADKSFSCTIEPLAGREDPW